MAFVVRCEWRRYPDGFHLVEREPKEGDIILPGADEQPGPDGWCDWLWLTPRNPNRSESYVLEGTDNRVCLDWRTYRRSRCRRTNSAFLHRTCPRSRAW